MELQQLRYIIAIAESGSFSTAAKRCGVTQPSLSQQVRKLEDELGAPLFDRIPRGAVLTETGTRFLPHARQVLSAAADAARSAGDGTAEIAGHLAVGAIPTIAPYMLPHAIARFARQHPGVQLQIEENLTEVLMERLLSGALDLAVMAAPIDHAVLHAEVLANDPLYVALPADHPLAKRRTVKLDDLASQRFVLLHEMHCLGRQTDAICRRMRESADIAFTGSQLSTIQQMVAMGVGVSLVPAIAVNADKSKKRVYRPLAGKPIVRQIVAVWHLHRYRTQAARAMQAELAAIVASNQLGTTPG